MIKAMILSTALSLSGCGTLYSHSYDTIKRDKVTKECIDKMQKEGGGIFYDSWRVSEAVVFCDDKGRKAGSNW